MADDKFTKVIQNQARKLIASKTARTVGGGYVLEFEQNDGWLICTTWGYDYDGIKIPATRPELIAAKCAAQLNRCSVSRVAVRFYLNCLRALDELAT